MNDPLTPAITAIHNGGVICYPTEGVWGLGCHPASVSAFERLLDIKQRPANKGVILLAGNMAQVGLYTNLDAELMAAIRALHGEFVTCVLPKNAHCPDYLSGTFDSVAVRLTHYTPLRQLCLRAGTPLVSSSANISGRPPVKNLAEARATFGNAVDCYIDSPLGGQAKPSRIVAWTADKTWMTVRD